MYTTLLLYPAELRNGKIVLDSNGIRQNTGTNAATYPKGEVSGPLNPSLDEGGRLVFGLTPLSLHEGKHPRIWTSLSSVCIPFRPWNPCLLPPTPPLSRAERRAGADSYESRPGPGVEGSAASPWAPSLLLSPPRRCWPSQILRSNHRFSITNLTG